MGYKKGFYITECYGNNAFSYEKRCNLKGGAKIFVPSLIEGNINDIKFDDEIVFEEIENDKIQSHYGLKNLVKTSYKDKPVYIVDNHNHVLYFRYKEYLNKTIGKNNTLIHIDQHSDMNTPDELIDSSKEKNLEYIFEYVNFKTNVGNYIQPAIKSGLVQEAIQLRTEYMLYQIDKFQFKNHIILNIDLDFWAPELDHIDNNLKIEKTKYLMEKADLITISTSPFFIDQKLALEVLRKLFE